MSDVANIAPSTGASESANWGSVFDSAMAGDTADTSTETDTAAESEDTGAGDLTGEVDDVEAPPAEAGDDPAEEPEPAAEETTEQPKAESTEEDGVKERVRADGRKEFVLKESRYRNFHEAYKTARDVEAVLGEPLSREAVEARQNAFVDQQSIIADFLSGEASSENNVLNYFAQIAESARQAGEVAHDPLVNLASRMPKFFESNPQAYSALAKPILEGELSRLKTMAREKIAANKDDDSLALSIEFVEHALYGGKYQPRVEFLKAPDPIEARKRDLDEREERLNQVETTRKKQEWAEFSKQATADVKATIFGVIEESLKDVAAAYADFPEDFSAVKNQLHGEFTEQTRNDAAWRAQLNMLMRKAQIAATPSARAAVKTELLAKFKAKADYLLNPVRNESVKNILSRRAAQMKSANDAQHKRLATAAAQRQPGAPGVAVPASARAVKPNGSGKAAFSDFFDKAMN